MGFEHLMIFFCMGHASFGSFDSSTILLIHTLLHIFACIIKIKIIA